MNAIFLSKDAKADYIAFNRYFAMGGGRMLINIFFPLVLFALGIQQILMGELWFGIFSVVMGVVFVPLMWILNESAIKKHLKENPQYTSIKESKYIFDDGSITLETTFTKKTETFKYEYSNLFQAVETSKYFFIYINTRQALIIIKNGLVEGDVCEVRKKLDESMAKKFKSRFKAKAI